MTKLYIYISISALIFAAAGCSGSKESYNREKNGLIEDGGLIRVLLDEQTDSYKYMIETSLYLRDGNSYLALVNPGNTLLVSNSGNNVVVEIGGKKFLGKDLQLVAETPGDPVSYKGNSYYGRINLITDGSEIRIINLLSVEQYLKGVIPKEMPLGEGDEYLEALKAFTICARTYTVSKIKENKKQYDVFADTRDQVYGGTGVEKDIVNKVIDETRNLILTYNDEPAVTFYSSTCGGHTEDAENVFPGMNFPYLKGVRDGDEPYCSISPKFMWTEIISEKTFIQRLVDSGYLDNSNYSVKDITINSTFRSGRINELEIDLMGDNNNSRSVRLYGNNIRYVIRTADNKSILESNNFAIRKDSDDNIIINGRGYGHGVGLCQWGALAQSRAGKKFEEILEFYYPGTKVENYNDK
jgi:stage II sporulation protein D